MAAEASIARNTVFALAVQVTTASFTAVLTLVLVRKLGPGDYGIFALALSLGGLLLVPSDFGISHSAARFIAERRGDRSAVAGIVADALKLKLLASVLVGAALAGCAGPIASAYGEPGLEWPLRAVAIAVLTQSVFLFASNVFVAQATVARNLQIVFGESAVEFGASLALVLLGAGATGAAFGRAIGYGFGAALGIAILVRQLGRAVIARRGFDRARAQAIARYAGALAVIDGAFTVFAQLEPILIGAFLSTTAVGLFNAPMRLILLTQYPGLAVANAVAPRLARHAERGPDVRAFVGAVRGLVVFQALLLAPVVVWAGPLVRLLLGDGYGESAQVLRVLAPYVFLTGLAPLVSLGVNYLGDARRRLPIALGTVLIVLVAELLLIPRYGLVGAAIGADIGFAVYVPAHIWVCRRMVGLPLRPLALSLARGSLAAVAMGGVLAALGTGAELSWPRWVAGLGGGTAAFLLVLVATREVAPGELARGVGAVRRRFSS